MFGNKVKTAVAKRQSSKKKNTYVVDVDGMLDITLWSLCRQSPYMVTTLNGQPVQYDSACRNLTFFPNPGAHNMALLRRELREIMGNKMSCTIVTYLDKKTGAPVVTLFPTTELVVHGAEDGFMQRLNHASRKDLKYQLELRSRMIDEWKARQK